MNYESITGPILVLQIEKSVNSNQSDMLRKLYKNFDISEGFLLKN